ncbi:hypothetical protein VB773_17205 [Haloarculaceae archaeon H-GB2-1]|nr:hypothetical protein [Haloarculaceae archaeon H-GB1-1]MEA5387649.1 hypothetical protein [Haloarculaceae archaeon H-GB11]MEA5409136.1 hypothetical protein [Haloarculaceae archaeon H-GB2-1]
MTLTSTRESTHRSAYAGLWMLAGLALGGLTWFGRPLFGVGLYVVAVLGALAVTARYRGPLFDERDASIHREASAYTLALFGVGSAVVFPALTALYAVGRFSWGPATTAIALFVAVIYVVYGVTAMVLSRRH